jgi:hypothetical protein
MRPLTTRVAWDRNVDYDGSQLRPHFLRSTFGISGDAAVAFPGACEVRGAHLVDLADRERGHHIQATEMLHVIVERFDPRLDVAILIQRLLVGLAADGVREALPGGVAATVVRRGDDLFVGEGKLSVSIATVSPVSSLIHLGINIDGRGAPVPTADLDSLGIAARDLAGVILAGLGAEIDGVIDALGKVVAAHPEPGA